MNVSSLVSRYVIFRRTLGERCNSTEEILRAFCRAVGPRRPVCQLQRRRVAAYLAGRGPLTGSWHIKYSVLKGFFRFAISRGHLRKSPLPTTVPERPPTLTPYIYSREELRRLLEAIPACQGPRFHIQPPTLRALLLLLYGAGLRRGEVLKLTVADVDLPRGLLTVREGKFFKSRVVPLGPDLTRVLQEYVRWRTASQSSASAVGLFFVGRDGKGFDRRTLNRAFKRLREHIGLRRTDQLRYQPRLHDLRHTFAVHRLIAWYRQGADVQRLLYHLSTYLGHINLEHTQVYLTMVPELLQQAGACFERYARREGHHD